MLYLYCRHPLLRYTHKWCNIPLMDIPLKSANKHLCPFTPLKKSNNGVRWQSWRPSSCMSCFTILKRAFLLWVFSVTTSYVSFWLETSQLISIRSMASEYGLKLVLGQYPFSWHWLYSSLTTYTAMISSDLQCV